MMFLSHVTLPAFWAGWIDSLLPLPFTVVLKVFLKRIFSVLGNPKEDPFT